MNPFRLTVFVALLGCASIPLMSDSILDAEIVSLESMGAFNEPASNWILGTAIYGDPRNETNLKVESGTGIIANVADKATGENLFTSWEHGDVELELEFLVPKGSNSGVYLQSRYEVQVFDSWGKAEVSFGDCGGIYQRYDEEKKRGWEGHAPSVNASRAPGLWQHLRIVFNAPRFDQSGTKVRNARFIEVVLNGVVLHRNVEVTGPTRAAAHADEVPMAPLMLQGDHGPVAFRNIEMKRYQSKEITLGSIACETREGESLTIGSYDSLDPIERLELEDIDLEALGASKNFAATFTGNIHLPTDGTYAFHVDAEGPVKLAIDGRNVLLPLSPGGRAVPTAFDAGTYSFRLDYTHGPWRKPKLNVFAEGPGVRFQRLAPTKTNEEASVEVSASRVIEPFDNRVRVQRGFIPHEPRKRLYAMAVGAPSGVHYAYDFDTASLIHAWNGRFLDTSEMWYGRGNNQLAKPAESPLSFPARPFVTHVQSTDYDWPKEPEDLWVSEGYTLDANGQPEFHARLADLKLSDKIVADSERRALHRTLTIEGQHSSWWTGVFLAEAETIESLEGGRNFIIGDREYYIDVLSDSALVPFVRTINGRDQLMIWVPKNANETNLKYTLVW